MPESEITAWHELNGKAIRRGKKGRRKNLPGICLQLSSSQKTKVKNDQHVFQKCLVRGCNCHHHQALEAIIGKTA